MTNLYIVSAPPGIGTGGLYQTFHPERVNVYAEMSAHLEAIDRDLHAGKVVATFTTPIELTKPHIHAQVALWGKTFKIYLLEAKLPSLGAFLP